MTKWLVLVLFLIAINVNATIIYADSALSSNITNGTYSVSGRSGGGSDGNAYQEIEDAITAASAGDTIYCRGGTFSEKVSFPANKQGSAGNWFFLASYPGEWAIIDATAIGGTGAVMEFFDGSYSTCPSYWKIWRLELTGGDGGGEGHESGGGIMFDTAHHIDFRFLYIHDNGANAGYNDGGIVIKNESQTGQYITIEYCWFEDTSCEGNGNCATIGLFSDYDGASLPIVIGNARHHNEIAYNRVIGGTMGIRSKSWQVLTNDHTGSSTPYTYEDYGDKIHHNIVTGFQGNGLELRQDFIQCYNNIVAIDLTTSHEEPLGGIVIGCQEYNTDREPFYAVVYNNYVYGTGISIEHQTNGIYGSPIHPYSYIYNNIIDSSEINMESRINFSICSNSVNSASDINMSTIVFENNLFTLENTSTGIIRREDDNYDIDEFVDDSSFADTIFNVTSTSGLFTSGRDNYITDGTFSVGQGKTIADGGDQNGLSHPYLSGITLPDYVGAIDPDTTAWVIGVRDSVPTVSWLSTQYSEDPNWFGGQGGSSPTGTGTITVGSRTITTGTGTISP